MIWLAKTVNDRLNVVETLRFQTVKKRFACVSVDMKNAVTTVHMVIYIIDILVVHATLSKNRHGKGPKCVATL